MSRASGTDLAMRSSFGTIQGVVFAHCGHGLIQAGAGAVGAGQTLIHVHAVRRDTELSECLSLRRQVLLVRGTPRVADQGCCHLLGVRKRWVERATFNVVRDVPKMA